MPKSYIMVLFGLCSIYLFNGCDRTSHKHKMIVNDTSEVIRIFLDSAFYQERFPDYSALFHDERLSDTIIFETDKVLINHFPTSLKYKLLTKEEICWAATQDFISFRRPNNFLKLTYFEKNDSTFKVSFQNVCVMPQLKPNPKLPRRQRPLGTCIFGFLCGGGMSLELVKQGDIFKTKKLNFWSD